jgi:glycosyltransferase involved in cell wall biosynthesis
MKNIAFIIGNLNKEHGGAQQLLFDICRHLSSSEFETTVYYMFKEGTFTEQFESHGTNVVDLAASSNYDLAAFYRLVRNLRSSSHDIIHTNSPISGCWGRVAAKLGDVPNIVSVEHNFHTEYSRFTRAINGITLLLTDVVVGVSQAVSNSYLDWEERLLSDDTRYETILNGVDINAIRGTFQRSDTVIREYSPYSPSDLIIGTMGRLHKQKGYRYLIRAFPKIKRQSPEAKLLILGDGPARDRLEEIANQSRFQDDIYFTGYVPDVYPFLPNFDISVFPSLWEGFGLTPVESMAAKRPVVGTDIPPFREVIGDAGALVEPEDESALAKAVNSLIESPVRRRELGQKGYERAIENFSIERTVKEYASLYRELVDE